MRLAPIQLLDYQVTSFTIEASSSFKRDELAHVDPADFNVIGHTKRIDGEADPKWAVMLAVRCEQVEGKNIPYRFSLELVGLVTALTRSVDEAVTHAVEVNGPSMLFGAAREIIREMTARGPHGPVLIPSASFFTPPPNGDAAAKASEASPAPAKRRKRIAR